jgi:choice-of-anchor B domain-containing protein
LKRFSFALAALAAIVLFAPAAHAQVGFGNSVAIADDLVFIGEPANQANPGYVYVYRSQDGEWVESGTLLASDATEGDGFGAAIAAASDLVMVSAVNRQRGVVYVYHRDESGEWAEVATIETGEESDRFGTSVARDGDRMVVGAPSADEDWGSAYVYEMQDHRWVEVAKLTGDRPEPAEEVSGDDAEAAAGDEAGDEADGEGEEAEEQEPPVAQRFGSAVGITGDWVVVGAPMANRRAGLVYTFRRGEDGSWSQAGVIGDDFSEENDRLGAAIHVAGHEALVGAPGVNDQGAVRRLLLSDSGEEWEREASLMPFDGGARLFGSAIAADDTHVYVSSPFAEGFRGVIYRYTRAGEESWSAVSKIDIAGLQQGHRFANSLAIAGDTLVAGIPGADFGAGKAAILSRTYGGWDSTVVVSEVKGMDPMTGERIVCADGRVGRFGCDNVDLLAYLPINAIGGGRGVRANDIWGWTDSETNRDYAIVGLSNATSFVDVTDPYNPVHVGTLPMTTGARASVWRDIKVHEGHAFIVADSAGQHGMQVFDLARLRDYDDEAIAFTEDVYYDNVASAHNVVINEESAFAFIVGASGGGETCGGGLHMVNIEDPKTPLFAGCFQDTRTGRRGTGYSHDAQCVIYHGPDERYTGREICLGSNETALSIADVTDKRNPVAVGMSSYPNVAYSHQGWLSEDHRYFYMNDEGDEASGLVDGTRTIIWDVQDLSDPIVVTEYVSDNPAIDHNLYTVGNVMYQSNYDSGLRIFDISDPENIAPIGYLDTVPFGEDGSGMGGSWSNYPYFANGIVVITSMNEGFFVAKLRDEANPDNTSSDSSE